MASTSSPAVPLDDPSALARFGQPLRVDADLVPPLEQDLPGREAFRLADVGDAADVHLDLAAGAAGFRVPGRQLGRALEDRARQLVELERIAHDDVAARGARDVKPEVARLGDPERQAVVVRVSVPGSDDGDAGDRSTARHSQAALATAVARRPCP